CEIISSLPKAANAPPASVPPNVNRPTGTQTNYSSYQTTALNSGPAALVDLLNTNLMHGTMSQAMKNTIVTTITAITNADVNIQARQRTQTAIYLVATSSQFQVER